MHKVKNINKIFLKIILLTLCVFSPSPAFQLEMPDSTNEFNTYYKRLYQIRLIQIKRVVPQLQNDQVVESISTLQNEAEMLAGKNEYEFALLILDEIDDLLAFQFQMNDAGKKEFPDEISINRIDWQPKFVTGMDSWQQRFELNYGNSDTVISENSMNPFAGIQIDFSFEKDQTFALTTNSLLKKSRDYFTITQNLRINKSISSSTEIDLQNYLDWTDFSNTDYVSYFQNRFAAGLTFNPLSALRFNVTDEFRLREYEIQEYYYANYFQNEIKFSLDTYFTRRQRAGIKFRLQQRHHPSFSEKNFKKMVFNFSGDFSLPLNTSVRIFNDLTEKVFSTQNVDTLYQSNYWEDWLVATMNIPLTHLLSLEFNDNFTLRNYENEFSYLRDNFENEIDGNIQFHINPNLTFQAGYFYGENVHRENSNNEDISARVEDYYSHGPTFSLDYFLNQKLLVNISNASRYRIYPNAEDIENFTLYSDRNLKSLFIFINWEINTSWQLNLITNYDTDQDQENENSDSRSTIFSFEILHRF